MKYFKTYEAFKKSYMSKIDLKDFKKIKKGSKVLYMGGQVEVLKNDGYVLTLKGKDGKKFTVNKAMFDHGGQINEDEIEIKVDGDYEIEVEKDDEEDEEEEEEKEDNVKEGIVNEKAKLKDLAKDLAELDKVGQSWITSITVEEDYDSKKDEDIAVVSVQGRAGDSTVKAYVNKLLKKLGFKPKFIQRNNKGDIHEYIWHLTQFTPDDVDKIDWKDLEYYRESVVNEDYSQRARNFRVRLRARLEAMKKGEKISYGKLSWTALGNGNFKDSRGRTVPYQDIVQDLKFAVQPDIMRHRGASGDEMIDAYLTFESINEGIVDDLVAMGGQIDYLYDADPKTQKIWKKAGFDPNDQDNIILYSYVNSWPETKKLLDKKRVKYKELEDPNSAGESYIVFKESLNELNTDGAIMNLWKKLYGEDFVSEYPAVAKILKVNRKNIDRRELARIWDETYGEDLKKEYPDFFKALK